MDLTLEDHVLAIASVPVPNDIGLPWPHPPMESASTSCSFCAGCTLSNADAVKTSCPSRPSGTPHVALRTNVEPRAGSPKRYPHACTLLCDICWTWRLVDVVRLSTSARDCRTSAGYMEDIHEDNIIGFSQPIDRWEIHKQAHVGRETLYTSSVSTAKSGLDLLTLNGTVDLIKPLSSC